MRTRTKALWGLLLVTAVCAPLVAIRKSEPVYQGRSLSEWLRPGLYNQAEAEHAIRAIGTNAIPWLVVWISYEPPTWRNQLVRSVPTSLARPVSKLTGRAKLERAAVAMNALVMLGTNALPAIPQLVESMSDPGRRVAGTRAMLTLAELGAPALPYLEQALSNPYHPRREKIVSVIADMMAPDIGTNLCLPALMRAAHDNDPVVSKAASNAVSRLTPPFDNLH